MTKESLDGVPDFITQPYNYLDNRAKDELNFSFKILILSLKPIFSGSVDHRVNRIDANQA
jgi:hypothetical protein